MDSIKKLETRKLLKELDFIESDFNYKKEIVNEADIVFIKCVNNLLEDHPYLKEIFDGEINKNIDTIFKKNKEDNGFINDSMDITNSVVIDKSPKMKKLYREIAKLTHPDKVSNRKLNDIYLKSTEFYESSDIAGIYSMCDILDIEYQISEEDNKFRIDRINEFKNRISFLESTITWFWYNLEDKKEKDKIIVEYIKKQIT